jgi:hypothetical protein
VNASAVMACTSSVSVPREFTPGQNITVTVSRCDLDTALNANVSLDQDGVGVGDVILRADLTATASIRGLASVWTGQVRFVHTWAACVYVYA